MKLPFDLTVEAGLLGAEIDYGTMTTLPQIKAHPYRDPVEFVVPGVFCGKGRIPVVLEAIRITQREYGHRIPVISSIVGPLTLSGMLYGVDTILFWMLAEPEKYVSVLRKATQFCIAYGKEQFRAGSDVVQIADPVSSGGSDLFRPIREICFSLPSGIL